MLQALGAVLVISSSTALGISVRQRLLKRSNTISHWIFSIDLITAEIEQNHTPLPEIIKMLSEQGSMLLRPVFSEMLKRMESQSELSFSYHWHSTIRDLAPSLNMDNDEVNILRQASSYLGRYQAEMQVSGLLHTRARLVSAQASAEQDIKNKGNVYRMCGIAAGIITVLMTI